MPFVSSTLTETFSPPPNGNRVSMLHTVRVWRSVSSVEPSANSTGLSPTQRAFKDEVAISASAHLPRCCPHRLRPVHRRPPESPSPRRVMLPDAVDDHSSLPQFRRENTG